VGPASRIYRALAARSALSSIAAAECGQCQVISRRGKLHTDFLIPTSFCSVQLHVPTSMIINCCQLAKNAGAMSRETFSGVEHDTPNEQFLFLFPVIISGFVPLPVPI